MPRKLHPNELHMLRLIGKGSTGDDGWARVSKDLFPLVESLPSELVRLKANDGGLLGGYAKLTHDGEVVVAWA